MKPALGASACRKGSFILAMWKAGAGPAQVPATPRVPLAGSSAFITHTRRASLTPGIEESPAATRARAGMANAAMAAHATRDLHMVGSCDGEWGRG